MLSITALVDQPEGERRSRGRPQQTSRNAERKVLPPRRVERRGGRRGAGAQHDAAPLEAHGWLTNVPPRRHDALGRAHVQIKLDTARREGGAQGELGSTV